MYAEGHSLNEIATLLNNTGADKGRRKYWTAASISAIIDNPIYGGEYEWRKVTQAADKTITRDGQYVDANWSKADPKSRRKVIPPEERVAAQAAREDLRIADRETIALACARRERERSRWGGRHGGANRSNGHWLRPFMVCGECGNAMQGHQSKAERAGRSYQFNYFRCSRYSMSRQVMDSPVCKSVKVRQEAVEAKLDGFLARYDERIVSDLEQSKPRIASLLLTLGGRGSALSLLRAEMAEYVMARLPEEQHGLLEVDGGISLVEAYRHYYDALLRRRGGDEGAGDRGGGGADRGACPRASRPAEEWSG
jgi:hypothetical protein